MSPTRKKTEEPALPGYEVNESATLSADKGRELTGAFICNITEASIAYTDNEAQYVRIKFTIPGRLNSQGTLITYELGSEIDSRRVYLTAGKGKNHQPLRTKAIFDAIFMLLNVSPELAEAEALRYNYQTKEEEMEMTPQLIQLIGKEIGVVIQQSFTRSRKLINAFTKEHFARNEHVTLKDDSEYLEAKNDPDCMWIEDIDAKPQPSFIFKRWFDPETGRTLSEIIDEKEPKKISKLLLRLQEADDSPKSLIALDEEIFNHLKDKFGDALDTSRIIPYSGIDVSSEPAF